MSRDHSTAAAPGLAKLARLEPEQVGHRNRWTLLAASGFSSCAAHEGNNRIPRSPTSFPLPIAWSTRAESRSPLSRCRADRGLVVNGVFSAFLMMIYK